MKGYYKEGMGWYNPVIRDVGKILKIIPNYPAAQETYSNVLEIETDGGLFSVDMKYPILKAGGFCVFEPLEKDADYENDDIEYQFVSVYPEDGDEIDVKPNVAYLYGGDTHLIPITTDPRILCIMHRAHELPANPTEAQIKAFCKHIPTLDEATAYLKKIGALTDCVPRDEMYKNMEREDN